MSGTPPGARANGVAVSASWEVLGECDPRVADALLAVLAEARIAAYAVPFRGNQGGYLDLRPPSRPVDRVYVDGSRRPQAVLLVRDQLDDAVASPGGGAAADLGAAMSTQDAAFTAIVARFHAPEAGSWPAAEDVPDPDRRDRERFGPAGSAGDRSPRAWGAGPSSLAAHPEAPGHPPAGDRRRPDPFADDDNHYEPPPLGPQPPVHPMTRAAWLAVVAGLLLLLLPPLGVLGDAAVADAVGGLLVLGGTVCLVVRMHDDAPPEGDDDGAVV